MIGINSYKLKLAELKGERKKLESQAQTLRKNIRSLKSKLEIAKKAKSIMQLVAEKTQSQIEYKISELTTLSLSTVFKDRYKFICKFKGFGEKSNHCHFLFDNNGYEEKPEDSSGGVRNIAALGLSCTVHKIADPKTRDIIFLEEPFLELKGKKANIKALKLLNTLSKELKIQFIIISDERVHLKYIKKYADKVYMSALDKNGNSIIEEVK